MPIHSTPAELASRILEIVHQFDLPVAAREALLHTVGATAPRDEITLPPPARGRFGARAQHPPSLAPIGLEADDRPPGAPAGSTPPDDPLPLEASPFQELLRYQDQGVIAIGGMGEVRLALDRELNRSVAIKIIRQEFAQDLEARARFVEEAQATAQLQHPGIVPVHELGQLPDGRWYFVMKEVRGRTLGEIIQLFHAPGSSELPADTAAEWTLRRLLEAFRKVVEAVAYAHSRGVVHRDLKPSNVMVGDFGEVLVVDWGLARVRGFDALAGSPSPTVITSRSSDGQLATQAGTVAGTPAYMPPEQARGELHRIGPPSDVYALGAILYELLSGRPPYTGPDVAAVLAQVTGDEPVPLFPSDNTLRISPNGSVGPEDASAPPVMGQSVPLELRQICARAMQRRIEDRYPDARALAEAVGAWLEGAQRREQALKVLAQADGLQPEIERLRSEAVERLAAVQLMLDAVKPDEPIDRKRPAWKLEDEAHRLERLADSHEVRLLQSLQASLTYVEELPEAHERLAAYYYRKHRDAELARDERRTAELELLLQAHDRGRFSGYLRGDGMLTFVTDPPGASVELFRFVLEDRRMVAQPVAMLGRTPLTAVTLPMGSYLLKVRAPGRVEVLYPVQIGRQEHWDGIRPGDPQPFPLYLPRAEEVGPDDIYVPAGWFWTGGDPQAYNALPLRRIWVDGFVIQRTQVTNRDYLEFLNDLVAQGRDEEALRWAPRLNGGPAEEGPTVLRRNERGFFELGLDEEGDLWLPEWPMILVSWACGMQYARWKSARSGVEWRLPGEFEWEKAGRGVDGRCFPWGDFADPTWTRTLESCSDRPTPCEVEAVPGDSSPYGVHGMGGNVRQWCLEIYRREGPPVENERALILPQDPADGLSLRSGRGGAFMTRMLMSRCACRFWDNPQMRNPLVGLRLARSLQGPT